MKRGCLMLAMFFACNLAWSQADWSWTFQRWGNTCGLLFEDTNLTFSVKAAIRDDVCRSYSFVLPTNLFTRIYVSGDPKYGTFVGFDGLQGDYGSPSDLCGWNYVLHNGDRYFYVAARLSSLYLQKIALTNQYQTEVGSLSNFLHLVNGATTNNVIPSEYLQLWWSMKTEQPLSLTFSRVGGHPFFRSEAEVREFCGQFSDNEVFVPSILNFRYREDVTGSGLFCGTFFKKKSCGTYELGFDLIYRSGSWRLVLPEY